jgi:hypothetical protein
VNLGVRAPTAPHLLYIALHDGGPPIISRLGAPDQGTIKDSDLVKINPNILPLDLILLTYFLHS